jgi:uncharacterized membrane protein YraQ (UPF0718 family)
MVVFSFLQGDDVYIEGFGISTDIFLDVVPLLILAFIVAGMVQVLIPAHIVSRWIGSGSGNKGIMIASAMGANMPGGPFTSLPIAAVFLRSGASIGMMVAFYHRLVIVSF